MTKVLLVDDEAAIAPLIALCLEPLGVEVIHCMDLEDALRVADREAVGLVLLDLALDAEDGMSILPRMRAHERLKGIPVVAFSAHDSRRQEALAGGACSFVGRPFAGDDLRSAVALHLRR